MRAAQPQVERNTVPLIACFCPRDVCMSHVGYHGGGVGLVPSVPQRPHLTKQKHKLAVWQTNLISEKAETEPPLASRNDGRQYYVLT